MYRIQFAQLAVVLATVLIAPGALAGPAEQSRPQHLHQRAPSSFSRA